MCVDPFFHRPGSVDSNQVYRLLNTTITKALKLEPNNASWIIIQGHIFCGKHTYAYYSLHVQISYTQVYDLIGFCVLNLVLTLYASVHMYNIRRRTVVCYCVQYWSSCVSSVVLFCLMMKS